MKLIALLTPYEQSISMAQNLRRAGKGPRKYHRSNALNEGKVMEPSQQFS